MALGSTAVAADGAGVFAQPASSMQEDGVVVMDETRRFERLVGDHHAFVWRSLRRLGVPVADLDDATQEVFVLAAKNLRTILVERERGYLFKSAIFVAAHARRTARRRRKEVSDDDQLYAAVDPKARPDESAEANEARERLQTILNQLPDELRGVFVLYELERFTMQEISDALALPSGTVASRLRRAREVFMSHAKQQGAKR